MAAMIDDDTQMIVVGTGNDRVAINLKQTSAVSLLSNRTISIIIEYNNTGSIAITSSYININRNGRY
jgi:hypothetical protein